MSRSKRGGGGAGPRRQRRSVRGIRAARPPLRLLGGPRATRPAVPLHRRARRQRPAARFGDQAATDVGRPRLRRSISSVERRQRSPRRLLDDPTEAWKRAYGSPVPVTFDVEWGTDTEPVAITRLRASGRGRRSNRVDGGSPRARRARSPSACVGCAVSSAGPGHARGFGRAARPVPSQQRCHRRPSAHSDRLARTYARRVSRDILEEFDQQRGQPVYPTVAAAVGQIIEDRASGFCGDVIAITAEAVTLRDRHGGTRQFRCKPGGFLIDGRPVTLVREQRAAKSPRLTNSGAVAGASQRARLARASRIWVEGHATMPTCANTCGATSWPSWRSSSSRCTALTVWSRWSASSGRQPASAGHSCRSPRRRIEGGQDHQTGGRSRCAGDRPPVCGRVARVRPQVMDLAEWPDVPRSVEWKQGLCDTLGKSNRRPSTFFVEYACCSNCRRRSSSTNIEGTRPQRCEPHRGEPR